MYNFNEPHNRFKVEELSSRRAKLDGVDAAFAAMEKCEVARRLFIDHWRAPRLPAGMHSPAAR